MGEGERAARDALKQAEAGKGTDAEGLERARARNPKATEAVEQESADGPEGRGVAR
jgi:hypothetical protein